VGWLLIALVSAATSQHCAEVAADNREGVCRFENENEQADQGLYLMQQRVTSMEVNVSPQKVGTSGPVTLLETPVPSHKRGLLKGVFFLSAIMIPLSLCGRVHPSLAVVARAVRFGGAYIIVSSVMIESNKWLMSPGRFPFPVTLTFNHMLSCTILANILRKFCPSLFPAMQGVEVTPRYCVKFLGLGVPFMLSTVCGNWAYKFLSVSFLQIMKQTNVVTIYALSVVVGLEALRRCSVILLFFVLAGAIMAVHGELHFMLKGFVLQMISSWSEATKVVFQSFLMSGQAKLDPLSMILFMAPACFLANLIPWAIMDYPQLGTIMDSFVEIWPLVLGNMLLAFVLNIVVAQCIRELSAVGFLLCGVVKDNCIVLTSTIFLGEILTHMQRAGFIVALTGVLLYSLYKQNLDCFKDDNVFRGFGNLIQHLLFGGKSVDNLKAALEDSHSYDGKMGNAEMAKEDSPNAAVHGKAEPEANAPKARD